MPHADEGLLHSYLDGALPAGERARLEAHLQECDECRANLDAERALVARANALLGAVTPPELRRVKPRRWRIPAAWAASLIAAFAAGWYLHLQPEVQRLGENATQIAGARPQETPPARVEEAPAPVRRAPAPARRSAPAAPPPGAAKAAPPSAVASADAAPEAHERAPASSFDTAGMVSMLGRGPAALPGRPILRITRAPSEEGGGVIVEQEVGAGTVVRLYQVQIAVRSDEAAPKARAPAGAAMARAATSERLARYLGTLRVEIEGPLPADSLSKLLDLVR